MASAVLLPRGPQAHCSGCLVSKGKGRRGTVSAVYTCGSLDRACSQAGCKAPPLLPSPEKVVSSEALDGVPILVLANKQDVEVSPALPPCTASPEPLHPHCKRYDKHMPPQSP
jgi:hypothetical protein